MINKTTLLLLLICAPVCGQSEFDAFLAHINSISSAQRQAAADSFYTYAKSKGIPFIENQTAAFIYRGAANSLGVAGDFNGWDFNNGKGTKIEGTNFFYFRKEFEPDARLDYKFVLNNSNWILDPGNPKTVWGGFGPNSELAMPEYIQPWEINYNPSIIHGSKKTTTLYSVNVGKSFSVTVYLPRNYGSNESRRYPSVYFQDGSEYIDLASAVNVIDNLIDSSKIEPVIGVFVKPNNRNNEYAFDLRNKYVKFFAEELVPYIDSVYRTLKTPGKRLVLGDSYGGNISGLIAFRHPELFGNCGLHSAAFQPNNYEVYNLWINSDKLDVKFYSVWGTYEGLRQNMNNFRDVMLNKGYRFGWGEFHEGHSWGLWRATIDLMLEYFYPPIAVSVKESGVQPEEFRLFQNYPNPFNSTTTIKYTIPTSTVIPNPQRGEPASPAGRESSKISPSGRNDNTKVILKVYDILGREIAELVNKELSAGNYEVEFNARASADVLPSGIYFYRLSVGGKALNGKMTLVK